MIGSSGLSDGCTSQSVESLVREYDEVLCKALDKLAPKRTRTIVIRPNAPRYNEEIATQKRKRQRLGHKWCLTGLEIDRLNYMEQCNVVNDILYKAKEQYYSSVIQENECTSCFSEFTMVTDEDVLGLIRGSTIKACALDPVPASVMRKCYSSLVPIFRRVINLYLSSGSMTKELKAALLSPILKKLNADCEQFGNFCPVSNLKFLSKLIEKTVFVQLNSYLGESDLHEPLQSSQSAYKIFHSTQTALLTVTNDIMLSLDKGENVFLILLDLSAAFDTVNHSLLLVRHRKSFGISRRNCTAMVRFLSFPNNSVCKHQRGEFYGTRSSRRCSPSFSSGTYTLPPVHCATC